MAVPVGEAADRFGDVHARASFAPAAGQRLSASLFGSTDEFGLVSEYGVHDVGSRWRNAAASLRSGPLESDAVSTLAPSRFARTTACPDRASGGACVSCSR